MAKPSPKTGSSWSGVQDLMMPASIDRGLELGKMQRFYETPRKAEEAREAYRRGTILIVRSNDWDGDDFGNEWRVHYVLYKNQDDDGCDCFDLYEDDGRGNGNMICRGYNLSDMRSLTLKLGEFVEWGQAIIDHLGE